MAAKYQVSLISSEYPPHICGGLGVHVDRMTASLQDRVQYDLLVPQAVDEYFATNPGIRIHEIDVPEAGGELEFWLRFCHASARHVRKCSLPAQLIHCHDWMTILAGVALRRMLGVPLVFNVHLPEHIGSRLDLENIGLVASDMVIVNSQDVREELVARELPIRRIEVVPNGVDSSMFCPPPNWPADSGYSLFVGRLVAQKGLDLLLRAFAVVLRRCPDGQLVVAGDGDLELYFRRMVRYLGFPDRVRFVNWQTGPALVKLYQQAQVVVIPSYYEPFGIVALEAMACGRPVIASRVGGLSETIEDGVQGYLVPIGDHLELARRLSSLILDSNQRRKMGSLARSRALKLSWSSAASQTMSLYSSLIGNDVIENPTHATLTAGQNLLASLTDDLKPLGLELLGWV